MHLNTIQPLFNLFTSSFLITIFRGSRRFKITKSGLKEVTNQAPQIQSLNDVTIARGGEFDPLKEIKNNKIKMENLSY